MTGSARVTSSSSRRVRRSVDSFSPSARFRALITTRRGGFVLIAVLLAFLGVGCSESAPADAPPRPRRSSEESVLTGLGMVTFVELEGGFFAIRGEDGEPYFPLELDERFRKNGLRVHFEARKVSEMTIQQWGTPIRIISISVGDPAVPDYVANGRRVRIDEPGEDGTASALTSVAGDLNDDGRDDLGVLLVLNSSGSGVFYYLNVFLNEGVDGWRLVGEEFLGDRIGFDFMEIYREGSVSPLTGVAVHPEDHGKLVVAYSARSAEQLFSEEPNLKLTRHWRVDQGKLILIEDY